MREAGFLEHFFLAVAQAPIWLLILVWLSGLACSFLEPHVPAVAAAVASLLLAGFSSLVYVFWPYGVHRRLRHLYEFDVERRRLSNVIVIVSSAAFAVSVALTVFAGKVANTNQQFTPAWSMATEILAVLSGFALVAVSWGLTTSTLVQLERSLGRPPRYALTLMQLYFIPFTLGFLKRRIDRLEAAAPKL